MRTGKRSKLMPGVIAAAALIAVGCEEERSGAGRGGPGPEGLTAPTVAAAAGTGTAAADTGKARYWKPIE